MILIKSCNAIIATLSFVAFAFAGCEQSNILSKDPVGVYLTWQRSPDTTMTVQWVAPVSPDSKTIIMYHQEGLDYWQEAAGEHVPLPQNHDEQHIHTVELTDLDPDTIYHFRLSGKDRDYKFRTMPSRLDSSVRFVVGGDMYHETEDILQAANERAAKTNPRFVIAGGDLAYAAPRLASNPEDYVRWMEFIHRWSEDMVTSEGLMIPMLPVIGNHDVSGRYGLPNNAKFYYALFAMPQGYNVLDFGNYMSVVMLDTDHTHPIEGKQTEWLAAALSERELVPHKFTAYHIPAWPSVRNFEGKYNPIIRANWVPLFEKYGVDISFEHHEHAFKRSHPLKNGQIDEEGVVYMGDGAWGVTPRTPYSPEDRWYLAKSAAAQHFIMVDITTEGREVSVIDIPTGKVIDHLSQDVRFPKPSHVEQEQNDSETLSRQR